MRVVLLVIALFFTPAALADITARVVAVTDGDTIKVLDERKVEHKVRLLKIAFRRQLQPLAHLLLGGQLPLVP